MTTRVCPLSAFLIMALPRRDFKGAVAGSFLGMGSLRVWFSQAGMVKRCSLKP